MYITYYDAAVAIEVCVFSTIFLHHLIAHTRTVCIKILGKNSKGIVQVKYREYENWRFFPPVS